jgi:(S)-3,5-dihydroxyphenylglycine transaminase
VTVGAQEAAALVLSGLFEPGDILLVSDPTYLGITALARLLHIRVMPVQTGSRGVEANDLETAICTSAKLGRVRMFYSNPDFSNPVGTSLSLATRHDIIQLCRHYEVLILEDNPYGMFAYDHRRLPTLKALDGGTGVIYIGSFSKTLAPGLRVGYLIADQPVRSRGHMLAHTLARAKSILTINTPTLPQAIVGGLLLESGGSLEPIVAKTRDIYKTHRDVMAAALIESFADTREHVSWKVPTGGFFLGLTLPFEFDLCDVRECAFKYGVLVSPMRLFSITDNYNKYIRLCFSYAGLDDIKLGIHRLASFVRDRALMQ